MDSLDAPHGSSHAIAYTDPQFSADVDADAIAFRFADALADPAAL